MKTKYIYLTCLLILSAVFISFGATEAVTLVPTALSEGINSQFLTDVVTPGGVGLAISFAALTYTEEVGYADNNENMGGFGILAFLAFHSEIEDFPTEVASPTTLAELVELQGDYVMKATKYFIKVKVTPNSLKVTPEGQGEIGGSSFKPKVTFTIPSLSADNRGLARRLNNALCVLVIPDDSGNFRHNLGTENRPCVVKIAADSGANGNDFKHISFELTTDSFAPTYTYNGPIPLGSETLPAVS